MEQEAAHTLGSMADMLPYDAGVLAEYLQVAGHAVEPDPDTMLTPEQVAFLMRSLGGKGGAERFGPEEEGSATGTDPVRRGRRGELEKRIQELEEELLQLRGELARERAVEVEPEEPIEAGPAHFEGPEALEQRPDGSIHWRPGVAQVAALNPIDKTSVRETVEVTPQFAEALNLLEQGGNTFITGQAGTGKSTLLKLFRQHTKRQVVVLAPTGVAALQVGGQTLHSFFNLPHRLVHEDDIKFDNRRIQQYCAMETLVIDEISMVRADVFHAIDITLRAARPKSTRHLPFGGVQVVLIGDLHQLPPVVTRNELPAMRTLFGGEFFFNAPGYLAAHFEVVELKRLFRQRDPIFIKLLNQVRRGHAPPKVLDAFRHRVDRSVREDPEGAPKGTILLMGTNRMADDHNNRRLEKLDGEKYKLTGKVEGKFDRVNLPAPLDLYLKEGAQVMFLKNDREQGYVNGSIGTVLSFKDGKEHPLVEVELDGRPVLVGPALWEDYEYELDKKTKKLKPHVIGRYVQHPLKLAWAITVHKSQGLTFDRVHIALGKGAFAHGQTYVALSRCRSLEGITLDQPLGARDMIIDRFVVDFFRNRYRPPMPSAAKAAEYDHWNVPNA